jgi:hypothetical protein
VSKISKRCILNKACQFTEKSTSAKQEGEQQEQTRQAGKQGRLAWRINEPALTANIFATATSITNIHSIHNINQGI